MLRQRAFIPAHPLLKGALHSHSTRSDGKQKPQEVLRDYHKAAFDFVALTDHRLYNYKHFAPETGITIIPGMEMDRDLSVEGVHCFHTVCIGPLKEDGNGFDQDESYPKDFVSGQEEYQQMLDMIHDKKNLTIYCHPDWSGTPAREFEKLKGNIAMEVWNSGCALDFDCDKDAPCWDELLRQGIRIFGVATDDGHVPEHVAKGWVMVNCENKVSAVLDALKEGAFYSSCGPEIKDFYVEDGEAVIECSPACSVLFVMDKKPNALRRGGEMTKASCPVPEYCTYVRAVVTDSQGRKAWTNPIWLEA